MKKNRKQIAELAKCIITNETSIKTFRAQIDFCEQKIHYGEESLPRLKKEVKGIESGLPVWCEQLRIDKLSLQKHRDWLMKQLRLLKLLQEKDKILSKIRKLERTK